VLSAVKNHQFNPDVVPPFSYPGKLISGDNPSWNYPQGCPTGVHEVSQTFVPFSLYCEPSKRTHPSRATSGRKNQTDKEDVAIQ
jgi:hypothetical protein